MQPSSELSMLAKTPRLGEPRTVYVWGYPGGSLMICILTPRTSLKAPLSASQARTLRDHLNSLDLGASE